MTGDPVRDEIGPWSEIKLEIVKKYSKSYSKILTKKDFINKHLYIDAFAGAGESISRETGEIVEGSPSQAIQVDPPFSEYHFVELNPDKSDFLRKKLGNQKDTYFYQEDCNKILQEKIFPRAKYNDYNRALCLLDPYGLNLNWEVIKKAGKMRSIEIFLNFPIHDANRNVLWTDPENVKPEQTERMNNFWGDDGWKEVAYRSEKTLFGDKKVKRDIENVVSAFRNRLKDVAEFEFVPEPTLFSNTKSAPLYYLFFAAHQPVASSIVTDIFNVHRQELRNI